MGLFQRYLTDRVDDPTVIVKSWQQAGQSSDPIDVLDGLLPAGSIPGGIDTAITDFYAHNALWDYPQKDLMMGSIQGYEATYPSYKQLAAPLILSAGTDGLVDIAPDRHLHEHGAHQLVLSAGPEKLIELEIQGDANGTQGTPATWTATVIRTTADGITYTPVPFEGTSAEMSVQLPETEGSIRLTIVVHGDGKRDSETFGYKIRVGNGTGEDPEDPEDPEGEDPGCCSTSGGGAPGSALLALALLFTVSRRSRRARG
jgi:hypothetical protein